MSSSTTRDNAASEILHYSEQIRRLTPPRTFTDEVLLQVYGLLVDKYWKEQVAGRPLANMECASPVMVFPRRSDP